MRKCAIIIDDRPSKQLDEIIDRHMDFLPGWDLINIHNLPISNGHDYNRILTDTRFWENLEDLIYEKALIFQADSMMLKEIPDELLEYDFVGAPWKANAPWNTHDRRGGNGGISIRDVKAHALLTANNTYNTSEGNEDVWYSHNLPNVAPYEICSKFGVETEFKLGTCTYHAIDKHLTNDQCNQIINQYENK